MPSWFVRSLMLVSCLFLFRCHIYWIILAATPSGFCSRCHSFRIKVMWADIRVLQ